MSQFEIWLHPFDELFDFRELSPSLDLILLEKLSIKLPLPDQQSAEHLLLIEHRSS